jgi:hypothetical protein
VQKMLISFQRPSSALREPFEGPSRPLRNNTRSTGDQQAINRLEPSSSVRVRRALSRTIRKPSAPAASSAADRWFAAPKKTSQPDQSFLDVVHAGRKGAANKTFAAISKRSAWHHRHLFFLEQRQ